MGSEWNKRNPEKVSEATARYYARNREARLEYAKQRRLALREMVFEIYGNVCACCGESEKEFLTIDHIEPLKNKTSYERKALPAWLKKNGYPEGFQILCWNCNMAKRANAVCPHAAKK